MPQKSLSLGLQLWKGALLPACGPVQDNYYKSTPPIARTCSPIITVGDPRCDVEATSGSLLTNLSCLDVTFAMQIFRLMSR